MLCFVFRGVLASALASSIVACTVARPDDAYDPLPRVEPDSSADNEEDVYGDASQLPDLSFDPKPTGSTDDDDDAPTGPGKPTDPKAGDAGNGAAKPDAAAVEDEPDPAANPIAGDYWMRADVHATSVTSQLAVSIKTRTDTALYSLVRVGSLNGKLKFVDWQCTLRIEQSCESGCTSVSTTLLDAVKSAKAYAPAERDLTVTADGAWSVSRAPYAVGWRGDFANASNVTLPTSDADALVYDPDGGRGKGIDVTSSVRTSTGLSSTCDMRVVQKIDVRYEGKLSAGELEGGTLADLGSEQNELATSCGSAKTTTGEAAPSTLTFVRAKAPIASSGATWACPTLAEFESAFR